VDILARVPCLVRLAALVAAVAAGLALPAGAAGAVTEKLGVRYGSALDFDGERETLRLDLYRPPRRERPRPAIVLVHGGGFTFGQRSYMKPHAQLFARRGYLSATISYRLADGGELGRVGYGAAIRAAQHDAQAAVRWLRRRAKRLGVDPKRIYIAGHSAGAITALETAVSGDDPGDSGNRGYSSRVDGAIAIAGLLLDKTQIGRRDAPLLLFHGDADTVVPFASSSGVCSAAERRRLPCTLVGFPGGDHYVAYSQIETIVRRSARWLRRRW
jgi:dipeptidyl aminopeptidase/acylaminoacyl peptidase